ncbi:protein kinase [Nocardioides caeni]|uniref:non-specific serine/threonine protein kinase n=1 Tax=Nocardioides caeni TaxID=574700 RepID=A0A4S8N203_9ACTN|nr:protein kinase [Nocardioides caeni]THV09927.1 hypothetical protein E9934_15535 [Nocardioides caeni]
MRVPEVGDQIGRFRIDREIGRGGMGVVFAATDTRLDRTVALKVLTLALDDPEFLHRFDDEAAILARLDSPHVVRIIDHDVHGEVPHLVMQYVDGPDLGTHLRAHGPLAVVDALRLCGQVARGLDEAHRHGVLHRDVKLANVLVRSPGTADQHAYLCDFGIARAAHRPRRTGAGVVLGSWSTLAPERADGAPATPASDLYALGCVLWSCLTGLPPYPGVEAEVAIAHAQAPIPQLPVADQHGARDDRTTGINALLRRLLAKDPADRPADARSVRDELERLAGSTSSTGPEVPTAPSRTPTVERPAVAPLGPRPTAPPASLAPTIPPGSPAPPASPTPRRRSRTVLIAGVVTLAVVVAGVGIALALHDDPDSSDEDTAATGDRPTTTGSALPPTAGDLDGDGLGDLTVLRLTPELQPAVRWTLTSDGVSLDAAESTVTAPAVWTEGQGRLVLGDVDGDGRHDEIWSSVADATVHIDVLPAEGEPWEAAWPLADWTNGDTPLVADFDHDGRDDLAFVNEVPIDGQPAVIDVALAGDGGFEDPTTWLEGPVFDGNYFPHLVDLDGDGFEDLAVDLATFTPDFRFTYRLQALRSTTDSFELVGPEVKHRRQGFAANHQVSADLDGDGPEELIYAGQRGLAASRFDAEGTAAVAEPVWEAPADQAADWRFRSTGYEAYYLRPDLWEVSDLDGDGDDDVVFLRPEGDDAMAVEVYRAEDGTLSGPTVWATLPCSEEGSGGERCSDTFQLVSSTGGR